MSDVFTEHEDYVESEVELDELGEQGLVLLPMQIAFIDAVELGQVEDYEPRYQVTGLVPKGSEAMKKFIAVIDHIGRKTWKGEADEKLEACWSCIDNGIAPKNSNISLQDGDLYQTEYNSGCWWVKASRRADEGRPLLYDKQGELIYAPNEVDEDSGEIVNGELTGNQHETPKKGDLAAVLIRVWAQKKRERINFSVQGIRYMGKGKASSRAIAAQSQTTSVLSSGDVMPSLPSGMEAEESTPAPRKAPAKKAAKKSAKKGAAKKAGSVFKKKGGRKR